VNSKQRTILVLGLIFVVLMGLYPPWRVAVERKVAVEPGDAVYVYEVRAGYGYLFSPELRVLGMVLYGSRRIDISLLVTQWIVACAITGVLFVGLSDAVFGSMKRLWRALNEEDRRTSMAPTEGDAEAYCYHCGQSIEKGQSACPACGKQLDWSDG